MSNDRETDDQVHGYFESCCKRDRDHYSRWAERLGRRVRLRTYHAVLKLEGGKVVSTCPELDVASEGPDVPEALVNLETAVRAFLAALEPGDAEGRRRKVYTTEFVIEEDPEYEAAIARNRRRRIGRLAGEGLSPAIVAQRAGLTVAEVEAMWDEALSLDEERRYGLVEGRDLERAAVIRRLVWRGQDDQAIASLLEIDEYEVSRLRQWAAPRSASSAREPDGFDLPPELRQEEGILLALERAQMAMADEQVQRLLEERYDFELDQRIREDEAERRRRVEGAAGT